MQGGARAACVSTDSTTGTGIQWNMEAEISTEAEAVEKMNDEKMIRALNSNVKLGCLQSVFEKVKEI